MKKIADMQMLGKTQKSPEKANVNHEVKQGYMTHELTERMLSKMKKHINFFMFQVKTESDFDSVVNDWFRYLKNYRKEDVYKVFDMFMTTDDEDVHLPTFLSTLRSVAHRNAIAREQKQRENFLAIGVETTTKEKALSFLSNLKQQIA